MLTRMKRVSVVIAMFNAQDTILECLESVFCQEQENFEIEVIVVDDSSSDCSVQVCMNSPWRAAINLILLEVNSGQSIARNKAVEKSTGDFLMILDADDILIQGSLLELYRSISLDFATDLVFGNRIEFGNWGIFARGAFHSWKFSDLKSQILRGKNPITHSGALMRRTWFDEVGGYDPNDIHAEDLGLWIRGLRENNFLNIDLPTIYYRKAAVVRTFSYWQSMELSRRRIVGLDRFFYAFPFQLRFQYFKYVLVEFIRKLLSEFRHD